MRGIELFIILAVTALYFTIVTRSERFDQLVPNAEFFAGFFKERLTRSFIGVEAIRKLGSVVCLNTFDQVREFLEAMSEKERRGIGAVLLKSF